VSAPYAPGVAWLEAIGWAGSAVLVWSLLQSSVLRLRALNLAGSLVLVVYNAALAVWPMVTLNAVLAVVNVVHLRGLVRDRHDADAYEVVEVTPEDGYLRHLLRVHESDIRRHNPRFVLDASAPGLSAFLVVRGDETVGVVLVRDDGDGVARVELDYVTPRFRDLTPGEFVYRRSGLFADRGFSRVVTPPGMVAPYYARLGFRPEGESYVLDVAPG
jgi:energy-converting hydrogenase Eha subunit E